MAVLQVLALISFCGNAMAFLLDDTDSQDISVLNFTSIASSENILFTASSVNIRRCENEVIGWCSNANDTDPSLHLFLPEVRVVDSLTFESSSIDCYRVPTSDMERFTLQYLDPLDPAAAMKTYDMNISGPQLSGDMGKMVYDLNPSLYTQVLKIIPSKPGTCFALKLSGSNGTGLCHNHSCLNGGRCIGVNQCACAKGFMGERCQTKVTIGNIEISNFDFLRMENGIIETPSLNFNVTGNVTLQNLKSRRFLHWGHHHGCVFHGIHSAIHGAGSFLHHINPFHGFTHSFHVSFGHGHHHSQVVSLFQSHPSLPHGISAHCHYANNQLHFQVHSGGHVHHTWVPFHPHLNHNHHVVLSYSHHHGISVHLNGILAGSQLKPSSKPPRPPFNGHPGICVGICTSPGRFPIHTAVSNMVSAALHYSGLAVNGLMHLLSPSSTSSVTTKAATTALATTTAAATRSVKTTAATKSVKTTAATTKTHIFTKAPVTATSLHTTTSHSTTLSANGPLCYNCSQQATDGGCKTITKCKTGEVCALFHDANGYTHKCLDKQVCSQAKLLTGGACWKCCSGALCNDRCTSATKPCIDMPTCAAMKWTGFNICSNRVLATAHCRKSCHIC